MSEPRFLIVNADDFGLSEGANLGIAAAHERGIVTSTSLMVRQSAAQQAAALARGLPALAVGLHLDLGQWDYEEGEWRPAYERCPSDDGDAVESECRGQLLAFQELLDRDPTHLDSHQHVHENEPARSVAEALAAELEVPLRGRSIRYEGGFYGQSGRGEPFPEGISVESLVGLIGGLKAGWTELGCHPGVGRMEESSYGAEREQELKALCDPRTRAAIEAEGVQLRSFAELG
jgi:chitin disaccharide deacetylase